MKPRPETKRMPTTTYSRDDRRGGFYWLKGKPYVSVTNVLTAINKPALIKWGARQVYWGMVANPKMQEEEAVSLPFTARDAAGSRGNTIHSLVEAYKASGKIVETVPKQFRGYYDGFLQWIGNNKVKVLEQEKTVFSQKHGYAGTLDILCEINDNPGLWIVDVKTNKDGAVYPEHALQQSAYKQALSEIGTEVVGMAILSLKEDGLYNFSQLPDQFETFLATKKLWQWLNKDVCERVGYV